MTETYLAWQTNPIASTVDENSDEILQNLQLHEVKKPTPGSGQALVRIRAVALNYRDLLVTAFSPRYPWPTKPGLTPCADGAGSIEAVGPGSKWHVGDEVILATQGSWIDGDVSQYTWVALGGGNEQGTLQQYLVLTDHWLLRKPGHLSWEQAAALPGAGGTAINALFHSGVGTGLDLSGKTVLTQGSGGVSCATVQIAAAAGAKVIATSSADDKLELLKSLGAAEVVNYRTHPNWAEEVLKLTDGKGVDLVVDVAGAGTIEQSIQAARMGGTIVLVGFLTQSQTYDIVMPLIAGAKIVRGLLVASTEMFGEMIQLVDEHKIVPYIGKTFQWSEAHDALRALRSGKVVGKIAITV